MARTPRRCGEGTEAIVSTWRGTAPRDTPPCAVPLQVDTIASVPSPHRLGVLAMFDILGMLFGLAIALAIGFWLIGVPIILLIRTRRLGELGGRLERVERRLARLSREQPPLAVEETS